MSAFRVAGLSVSIPAAPTEEGVMPAFRVADLSAIRTGCAD